MSLAPLYAKLNSDGTHSLVIPIAEEDGDLIHIEVDSIIPTVEEEWERDAILGIERPYIPAQIIPIPDTPAGKRYKEIADAIDRIATFKFSFKSSEENQSQTAIMRCIQLKWQMRSIWFANKISGCPVPDLPQQYIRKLIPALAFENLNLEVPYDIAMYRLLQAGETDIRAWCHQQGIDYPFASPLDLFMEILRDEFLSIQEGCFELTESHVAKKPYRQERSRLEQYCRF